jgi:predicted SAM-dependent methyltransferase
VHAVSNKPSYATRAKWRLRRFARRIVTLFLPIYLVRQVENELKIAVRHFLYSRGTARRLAKLQGCRVNIGCGPWPTPGWINLDVLPFLDVHYWDCRRGLPFRDNTVAAIYSEHSFEHLDLEVEAKPYLKECLRCLRPGGILRLVVPDAGAYLSHYGESLESVATIRPLERAERGWKDHWGDNIYLTQMQFINFVFRQNYEHKYAYDEETLVQILRDAGFSKVARQGYGKSLDPEMTPDREDRRGESLYVEAIK